MPTLLMQDISIVGMFAGPDFERLRQARPASRSASWPTGTGSSTGGSTSTASTPWPSSRRTPTAATSTTSRSPPRRPTDLFKQRLANEPLTAEERKALEDHLFWYAVRQGHRAQPAGQAAHRLLCRPELHAARRGSSTIAGSACDLCRLAPETRFVFMHICYPYYEELIAVAKHYTNAYVDMCWSWIINPVAAKDFLKKYLVTAPANKILTFGGDYIPVEPVLGHAMIARRGIALALSELVEEGWLSLSDAMDLIDPIMHDNARQIFNLAEKTRNPAGGVLDLIIRSHSVQASLCCVGLCGVLSSWL